MHDTTLGMTLDRTTIAGGRIELRIKRRKRNYDGSGIVWGVVGGSMIWLFAAVTAYAVWKAWGML